MQRKYCEPSSKIPVDIKAISRACDKAEIAGLPDNWEPKRSGPLLAKYKEKCHQNYKQTVDDMFADAIVLNKNLDLKIEVITNVLQSDLKQTEDNIKCVIQQWKNNDDKSFDSKREALKKVDDIICVKVLNIKKFKKEGIAIERERAEAVRKLLREYLQKFIAVGYVSPPELMRDFEDRIYEANQQLLSNCRAYVQIETQLCAQSEEEVFRARSSLNQLALAAAKNDKKRSGSAITKTSDQVTPKRRSLSASRTRESEIDCPLAKNLDNDENVDECVDRVVEIYEVAIQQMFTNFYDNTQILDDNITGYLDQKVIYVLKEAIDRIVGRVSGSTSQEMYSSRLIVKNMRCGVFKMEKSLFFLDELLRGTYSLIIASRNLFDNHLVRVGVAQKCILSSLEDLMSSHDKIELNHDIKLNSDMFLMATCPTVDKTQSFFESVVLSLNQKAEMYQSHLNNEIACLEQYMTLIPKLEPVLAAEIKGFLTKHPNSTCNPTTSKTPSSLIKAVLKTEEQIEVLLNSRNDLLDKLKLKSGALPESLMRQAHRWCEENIHMVRLRYSMKNVMLGIRLERVIAVRDARLSQLHHHEICLTSYVAAAKNLVIFLAHETEHCLESETLDLFPFYRWLDHVGAQIDLIVEDEKVEVKRLKIKSYTCRIKKYREMYEKSLGEAVESYREIIVNLVQVALKDIAVFLSAVKMPYECGNYNPVEVATNFTSLLKATAELTSCVAPTLTMLMNNKSKLLTQADMNLVFCNKRMIEVVGK